MSRIGRSSNTPQPMPAGYFRRKLSELVSDLAGGIAAAAPPRLVYAPQDDSPSSTPAPAPFQPAVGFGGAGTVSASTAPETTDGFAPGSATVSVIQPGQQILGGGSRSRVSITNKGPGPAWIGSAADVDPTRSELVRAGETTTLQSSAPVFAIASPNQPANLVWTVEA